MQMHLHQKPPSVAGDHGHGAVPRVLVDVVRCCLQKSPDDRFDDAESLRAALLDAAELPPDAERTQTIHAPDDGCRAASCARRCGSRRRARRRSSPAPRSASPPATKFSSRSRCADSARDHARSDGALLS
jgi:hypothetical protein